MAESSPVSRESTAIVEIRKSPRKTEIFGKYYGHTIRTLLQRTKMATLARRHFGLRYGRTATVKIYLKTVFRLAIIPLSYRRKFDNFSFNRTRLQLLKEVLFRARAPLFCLAASTK